MSDYRNTQYGTSGRRNMPVRKNRRKKDRAGLIFVLLALIIAGTGIFFGIRLLNQDVSDPVVNAMATASVPTVQTSAAPANPMLTQDSQSSQGTLSQQLGEEGNDMQGLSEEQQVRVEDLKVNKGLPSKWMNVLLMGTDARNLSESSRSDTIIICSINGETGEVKLSSMARDTAIEYTDIGEYNGTYRINAASYFGGPELLMRTLNEKLGLNIEYYVQVNFYGFQYIVELLGGVDVNVTEAELEEINKWQIKQYDVGVKYNYDESGLEQKLLDTYGENTHLNGRQALAYCRIRKLDSDFSRTERQRTVLTKLMEKLKGTNAVDLTNMAFSMQKYFATNMSLDKILSVAITVLGNDNGAVKQFRLPVNGTYALETRNEQSMLYDCDWTKNSLELYNFIYE